jgi:hypothetical protein
MQAEEIASITFVDKNELLTEKEVVSDQSLDANNYFTTSRKSRPHQKLSFPKNAGSSVALLNMDSSDSEFENEN